ADVLDLIVSHRRRDQIDVVAAAAPQRIDHVAQEAEAGRRELTGSRAPALDVPLERKALLDEVVDVLAEDELVDHVVLERAADEEQSASPCQRADGEEIHVD